MEAFYLKVYLFLFYVYKVYLHVNRVCSTCGGQKRASDGCELHVALGTKCGCWELNVGLLEEQPALINTEPFLQPEVLF